MYSEHKQLDFVGSRYGNLAERVNEVTRSVNFICQGTEGFETEKMYIIYSPYFKNKSTYTETFYRS